MNQQMELEGTIEKSLLFNLIYILRKMLGIIGTGKSQNSFSFTIYLWRQIIENSATMCGNHFY